MTERRSRSAPEGDEFVRIGGEAVPTPLDSAKAAVWLADLGRSADEAGCERLARLCRRPDDPAARRLGAIMDLSSYLNGILLRRPDWLERLFDTDAADRIAAILASLDTLHAGDMTEARLMTALREAKLEAALLIALCDLFGAASPDQTTADLSDLAEATVRAALRFLLLDADRRGALKLPDHAQPEDGTGLFVLGMGKLGGRELNYSSDIDLVVLFEPDAAAVVDRDEAVETFSRIVRRLIRLLSERTGDGYVFRTDLRLRPDPGAMPLAVPVPTALVYYEDSGRNWERLAMLKARPVAGDMAAAEAFVREMAPFVWRKYLDFNSIDEVRSMKRRIDRHHGFDCVGIAGHDLKLGPGGIREIEFFAQAQQLIAGGRSPELRVRRTDEALRLLAEGGWILPETAARLTEAYWFLRRAEHAVQMVADEQTHSLPEDAAGLARIAGLLAFPDADAFGNELLERLGFAEAQFDQLFAGGEAAEDEGQRLFRMIEAGDLGGLSAALEALGFARAEPSARVLAGWGAGRYRATRSPAARRHLADVLGPLLRSLAAASDPDGSLVAFDAFIAGLPAGLQFFSLLASNPRVLDLLTLIVTSAPRLAATISQRPHVFDAFLDPTFFRELPKRSLLEDRLRFFMNDVVDYEDELVRLRLFASDQRFLVGARLLSGAIEGEEAGLAFADVADVAIARAFEAVVRSFAARHGAVPGGRIALFGMGRLGSRELTAGSDVDLILFYDHPQNEDESDGEKPLPASVYHARLTQRLIAALGSPMGEGVLYEVDFRLRPSGNKGPLATHIDAFLRYQADEGRTWERMALTRSRFLAGDAGFGEKVSAAIRRIIAERNHDPAISAEVAAMRALIGREKPARGPLDLKLRLGGLIDLEFLAQWSVLTGAVPADLIGHPTAEILAASNVVSRDCVEAMRRQTRVLQLLRLGPEKAFAVDALPEPLARRLAASLGLDGAAAIEPAVEAMAAEVRREFERRLPNGG
ncbi:bifunctional [glutamine synthetase] adenylyltransferase/[glutamine synthetase]-adenylyl-L-tyrosine phosphorylase [Aureimonas leprariae]|nr:bifunctional [glutamine synthetase] adenylyltransferase/[glutamine synthetase]-adenylyl-L-tyrosine phosphorylase [Aureimonas leprariae]